MKKMHKTVNMALIFMLIGVFLCQDLYALRIPMTGHEKVKRALDNNSKKHGKSGFVWERSQKPTQPESAHTSWRVISASSQKGREELENIFDSLQDNDARKTLIGFVRNKKYTIEFDESANYITENPIIQDKGISTLIISDDKLITRLKKALLEPCHHLESNAIESGANEIIIRVGVSKDDKYIVVDFIDNGDGVHKDFRNKLFKERVTSKGYSRGGGLGALICKSLVEKQGGVITLFDTLTQEEAGKLKSKESEDRRVTGKLITKGTIIRLVLPKSLSIVGQTQIDNLLRQVPYLIGGKQAKREKPNLVDNSLLRDFYREESPEALLLKIKASDGAPFEIYDRDVRSYSLNLRKAGGMVAYYLPELEKFTTATYYTRPKQSLDTEDEIIAYVKKLLNFAANAGKKDVSFLIIKDGSDKKIKELLKKMCRDYSEGLIVPPGCEHAYRQVNLRSQIGKNIKALATYLNIAYGRFLEGEEKPLPSSIFVDEEGYLFFAPYSNFNLYKLAYLLGKDIVNVVDIRFPRVDELKEINTEDIKTIIGYLKKNKLDRLFMPFERAVSDYNIDELRIKDPKKARSARIVWLLWIGMTDAHYYNSMLVDGVPIDFDFNAILQPFEYIENTDLNEFTSLLTYSFLICQTEEMDSYHNIEGYDLAIIPQTIQSIIDFDSLQDVVKKVGYPSSVPIGDIKSIKATYRFFDKKRKANGRWLWEATALTLSKLTGTEMTVEELKKRCDLASGETLEFSYGDIDIENLGEPEIIIPATKVNHPDIVEEDPSLMGRLRTSLSIKDHSIEDSLSNLLFELISNALHYQYEEADITKAEPIIIKVEKFNERNILKISSEQGLSSKSARDRLEQTRVNFYDKGEGGPDYLMETFTKMIDSITDAAGAFFYEVGNLMKKTGVSVIFEIGEEEPFPIKVNLYISLDRLFNKIALPHRTLQESS